MAEINRLNNIWNDTSNTDNVILIRVLNTFLETGEDNPEIIFNSIGYFTKLFDELLTTTNINRQDIRYVVNKIQYIEMNPSFDNFIDLLDEVYKKNMQDYKYLFLLCYCRARFEIYYADDILYDTPSYATRQAFGESQWNIFLEAFNNDEYTYNN